MSMIDTLELRKNPTTGPIGTPGWLRWTAALLVITAFVVAGLREPPDTAAQRAVKAPVAGDYQSDWRNGQHVDLEKTLTANHVDSCALMAYRSHRTVHGQYLVYCSQDGRRWTAWLAWPGAQKVMGPYAPDPLVPAPR